MKILYPCILIVVLGLCCRLYDLDKHFLWYDEQQTVLEANGIREQLSFPVDRTFLSGDIKKEKTFHNFKLAVVERDSGNGIAYTWLMYWWVDLFGNSNTSVRMPSVIFSLLTIIPIFAIGRQLFDDLKSCYIAIALFLFHHVVLIYAQEARPYAMATFFIVLSTMFFLKFVAEDKNKRSFLYAIFFSLTFLISILTHYQTVYIAVGELVGFIFLERKAAKWGFALMSVLLIGFGFSLWLLVGGFQGLQVMAQRNQAFQNLSAVDPANTFYGSANLKNIVGGIIQMITNIGGIGFQYIGLRVRETVFFLMPLLTLIIINYGGLVKSYKYWFLLLLVFSAPAYAVVLALISHHIISFQIAYSNFSIPFFCLLIGDIIAKTTSHSSFLNLSRACAIIYVLIIVCSAFAIMPIDRHGVSQNLNLRSKAIKMELRYKPYDTLIFHSMDEMLLINLYFKRKDIRQQVK